MPLTRQNVVIHNELGRELNREQGLLMTCQFSRASFMQVIDIGPIFHPSFNRTSTTTAEKWQARTFAGTLWSLNFTFPQIYKSLIVPTSQVCGK